MADRFHEKIKLSLENSGLQTALDGNADRRVKARLQAYTSLPEDLQSLRQRAHAVRARTISNLDTLLEQFTDCAKANGCTIHWAADASQAIGIVLDIARQNNARLIAKSKTMVGEEIEINAALEKAGLNVVETDLGEYIVQLRHERPAHIITPAVHLRRSDVAQTFVEKLGVPYNEDIPTMIAIARQTLRQTFLNADIGISGVNFGVAEDGTICILTNEGNGRMITTLPRVHIALMGIERLLPTLEDLALMLLLLPRSATGQKLTVYTSLIRGPRRPGDPDGPEQRHLILVDNGRRSMVGMPLEESLYCIRCGACLNACPVFREIGGHAYVGVHGELTAYPGPIGSVLSPGLMGASEFGNLARASSLCGACREACPVDINLPALLLRVRAGLTTAVPDKQSDSVAHSPTPSQVPATLRLGLSVYAWAASSRNRFGTAQRLAAWAAGALAPRSSWLRLPAFTGWGASRDFPRPAVRSFHERFAQRTSLQSNSSFQAQAQTNTASIPMAQPSTEINEQNRAPAIIKDELVDQFCREINAVGGQAIICQEVELNARLSALLAERQVTRLQAWDDEHLPAGLVENLRLRGIEIVHSLDPTIAVGLTGAMAGLADTGTLILASGPGQPLSASMLPDIHIAILYSRQIYQSMASFIKKPQPADQILIGAPVVVLITGPSRTADIEMTLTIGVHGPREVIVFCLD